MQTKLKKIKQINKTILKNDAWLIATFSHITKRIFLMFFTLFMIGYGFEKSNISLYYFIIFFISFLFVYSINFVKNKEIILLKVIVSAIVFMFLFLLLENIWFLLISITSFFMFAEIYMVRGISSLLKDRDKKESEEIIAFAALYTIILPAVAFSLVGFMTDYYKESYVYILFLIQLFVLFLFLKSYNKENSSVKINILKLPIEIHLNTIASLLYNSIGFVGMFMLIPIIVLEIGIHLGFSDNIFSVFGLIIGIMCISNVVYNLLIKVKEINYTKMMRDNVIILCIIWILLSCIYILITKEDISKNSIILLSLISLPLVVSIDYFSKLWSIGMMNSLKELSIEKNIEYNSAMFLFNVYKNFGFSFGFLMVFLLYDIVNFVYIIISISIITIIYSIMTLKRYYI